MRLICRTLPLLCLAVFVVHARGANYYVAPTGLDTAPGTRLQPWKTIQKAADTLRPGDTVYVRAGTYGKVTVHVSGTAADGPVSFRNYPGETPVIDATNVTPPEGDTALFLLTNRSYVNIEGFILRNYQTANVNLVPAGVFLRGACQHVLIRGCAISSIVNTGGSLDGSGSAFGIVVYGSNTTPATDIVIDGNDLHNLKTGISESLTLNGNVTDSQVINNLVHDNNNIGIDFIGFEGTCPDHTQDQARNCVCRGNTVWNISSQNNQAYPSGDYSADGIYCDGATGILIEEDISQTNDIGIELASEHPGKLTTNIQVHNNTVRANRQVGLLLGGYAATGTGGAKGCTVTGNTFYQNDTLGENNGEVQLHFRTSNCSFTGNTFYAGTAGWLVTVPVSAVNNSDNAFDHNVYYAKVGAAKTQWSWNNQPVTGFANWKTVSGQDANSSFATSPPAP